MKHQQFYLPQSGKLVTQLLGGITFAYDLRLGHLRDRWKGLAEEYGPGSLGPENCQKNCQSEITVLSQWNGGWPPISTWITSLTDQQKV